MKIDIKGYPTFSGKLSDWKPFKRQFTAIAQTHALDYLLANTVTKPEGEEEATKFKNESKFLQSALTFSLAKSTSISKVSTNDATGNGAKSWADLAAWFEGQGSEETIATTAMAVINNHKLEANSHGGAEVFLEKFEQAI